MTAPLKILYPFIYGFLNRPRWLRHQDSNLVSKVAQMCLVDFWCLKNSKEIFKLEVCRKIQCQTCKTLTPSQLTNSLSHWISNLWTKTPFILCWSAVWQKNKFPQKCAPIISPTLKQPSISPFHWNIATV